MNSGLYPSEARYFADWWNKQPHKHKILVGGNHDRLLEKRPKEILPLFKDTHYLLDSGIEVLGMKFWGSPYTPTFFEWSFMRNRGEDINKHWNLIPDNTQVLITHGPPFGFLDQSKKHGGDHFGCEDLANALLRLNDIQLHVFGHIHGGYGVEKFNNSGALLVNASQVNEKYNVVNTPIVIDLHGGTPCQPE